MSTSPAVRLPCGTTTMHFNLASMQRIIQHYLDTVLLSEEAVGKVSVTNVKLIQTYGPYVEVTLEPAAPEGVPA